MLAVLMGVNLVVSILFLAEYGTKGDSKYLISKVVLPYLMAAFTYVLSKILLFIYDIFAVMTYQGSSLGLDVNLSYIWLITFYVDLAVLFISTFFYHFY